MDEPVGISILGALLIVAAVGCLAGVLARIAFGGGVLHILADMALGGAGAWLVIFFLPMHGYVLGTVIGWYATPVVGAVSPILLERVLLERAIFRQ